MISLVCRRKQVIDATARLGIDGGFWTRSQRDGGAVYARHFHRDAIWNNTFNGPYMMNRSLLLVWRIAG
jgi:hypothetical protein